MRMCVLACVVAACGMHVSMKACVHESVYASVLVRWRAYVSVVECKRDEVCVREWDGVHA